MARMAEAQRHVARDRQRPLLPDQITLPDGAIPEAVTMGKGWIGVVTADNRLLIFTPQGALQQEITIAPLPAP